MRNGAEDSLADLAKAIARMNEAGAEIARIIEYPAERGHAGEYIAAAIFHIQLEEDKRKTGTDGCFAKGKLEGKTVNIKWYGKQEGLMDICTENGADFYLVMTGPRSPAKSARGETRPWLISYVFLFESQKLLPQLQHVKVGVATYLRRPLWEMAEVYPTPRSSELVLSDRQRSLLQLFGQEAQAIPPHDTRKA